MRNRNRFFLFQPLERHDLFALARFDQLLVEVLHPASFRQTLSAPLRQTVKSQVAGLQVLESPLF